VPSHSRGAAAPFNPHNKVDRVNEVNPVHPSPPPKIPPTRATPPPSLFLLFPHLPIPAQEAGDIRVQANLAGLPLDLFTGTILQQGCTFQPVPHSQLMKTRSLQILLALLLLLTLPAQTAEPQTGRLIQPVPIPLQNNGQTLGTTNLPPETPVVILHQEADKSLILTRQGQHTVPTDHIRANGEDFTLTEPTLLRQAAQILRENPQLRPPAPKPTIAKTNTPSKPASNTSCKSRAKNSCPKTRNAATPKSQPNLRPQGLPSGTENIPSSNEAHEQEVLTLVNAERQKRNLPALAWNENLARAARYHAADMAANGYFDHDSMARPAGSPNARPRRIGSWQDRVTAFDPTASGENIAHGQPTPASVMKSWMNSSGHRANILRKEFQSLGIGFVAGHWVQNFGR
jgi:uncharacterized protein YkwD